ncbi:MAG: hypothetical protein ACTSUE_22605, partial [Promethearchaeota archaeon]
YHMPYGMIVNTRFNSNTSVGNPVSYSSTTDSAEWTGHYLLAEACRYATHVRENNLTLAQEALDNVTRVLEGYDKIIHVSPNGGMARYTWPLDEYNEPARDNRYLGEYNGQFYIYEDDTSRDMHNGVIMGLGFAYLLINDTATRQTIARLVDDMLTNLMEKGWLYINPEGDPNGTDLDVGYLLFGTGGYWTLAYLKVGALVNEEKYGPLYREYAIERDYIHRSNYAGFSNMNTVQSYYGLLLDWEVMFILGTLETDPHLKSIYLQHVEEMHEFTKYDRTAIFHAMWLAMNGITRTTNNDTASDVIIRDVEDCLMRYYNAPQRLPGRTYGVDTTGWEDENSVRWFNFFNEGLGKTLYPFWDMVYQFRIVANQSMTPDMRSATDFLWSRSPYSLGGPGYGYDEGTGSDYTVVYWICRYFNIIEPPADYEASITVTYGV